MSFRLVFRPEAVDEIEQATEWYENRAAGLGAEFLRALDAAVASVLRTPDQFPPLNHRMRRVLLRRFPYSLIYSVTEKRDRRPRVRALASAPEAVGQSPVAAAAPNNGLQGMETRAYF